MSAAARPPEGGAYSPAADGGGRRYVLAPLTLRDVAPPDLVRIAHAAGYDGLTLDISMPACGVVARKLYPMLGNGPMLRETLARLADSPLYIQDVQGARLGPALRVAELEPFFEIACAVGARYVVTVSDETDAARIVDQLGALADAAAPFGIAPALEFMAYAGVRDLAHANRVLDQAARANLVLMVDTLHLHRSGGTPAQLAATAAHRIPYLQICDAATDPPPADPAELRREALTDRRYPGDGHLPLAAMLAALPADLTLSIETPVPAALARATPLEHAVKALRKTRAVCGAPD